MTTPPTHLRRDGAPAETLSSRSPDGTEGEQLHGRCGARPHIQGHGGTIIPEVGKWQRGGPSTGASRPKGSRWVGISQQRTQGCEQTMGHPPPQHGGVPTTRQPSGALPPLLEVGDGDSGAHLWRRLANLLAHSYFRARRRLKRTATSLWSSSPGQEASCLHHWALTPNATIAPANGPQAAKWSLSP